MGVPNGLCYCERPKNQRDSRKSDFNHKPSDSHARHEEHHTTTTRPQFFKLLWSRIIGVKWMGEIFLCLLRYRSCFLAFIYHVALRVVGEAEWTSQVCLTFSTATTWASNRTILHSINSKERISSNSTTPPFPWLPVLLPDEWAARKRPEFSPQVQKLFYYFAREKWGTRTRNKENEWIRILHPPIGFTSQVGEECEPHKNPPVLNHFNRLHSR